MFADIGFIFTLTQRCEKAAYGLPPSRLLCPELTSSMEKYKKCACCAIDYIYLWPPRHRPVHYNTTYNGISGSVCGSVWDHNVSFCLCVCVCMYKFMHVFFFFYMKVIVISMFKIYDNRIS